MQAISWLLFYGLSNAFKYAVYWCFIKIMRMQQIILRNSIQNQLYLFW